MGQEFRKKLRINSGIKFVFYPIVFSIGEGVMPDSNRKQGIFYEIHVSLPAGDRYSSARL